MKSKNTQEEKNKYEEIKTLETAGWKLCVGCFNYFIGSPECALCPIETRKIMGLPPKEIKNDTR